MNNGPPIVRERCPWTLVGENTGGGVYWCKDCGAIVDEDGTNLETPMRIDHETYLCHDLGYTGV
jgi:hypothetical protein